MNNGNLCFLSFRENPERGREDGAEGISGTWAISAFFSPFPAGFTSVFTLVSVLSSSQGPTGCIPPFVKILRSTEMMGNEMVKP